MRAIDRLREKAASRLRAPERGGVILLYHRIADVPLDPSGLSVSPARFEAHIEWLARRTRPCRLERMTAGGGADSLRSAVAVTLDDGYADNLRVAKPILERLEIPATVFIPSGAVGRQTPFWWDELETLVFAADALPETLDLEIGGGRVTARVRDDGGRRDRSGRYRGWRVWRGPARTPRQNLYERLWRALRGLREPEQRVGLDAVAAWAGVSERPAPAHPLLDAAGVRELLGGGLIDLGAHSMTHPSLPDHPPAVQREEIVEGRGRLGEAIGCTTTAFAYPYGAHDDTTVEIVREAGFERAVTTTWGAVTPASDPHRLPRLSIADWEPRLFERRVTRFLFG